MSDAIYDRLPLWASKYANSQNCWEFWKTIHDFRNNTRAIIHVLNKPSVAINIAVLESDTDSMMLSIHPKGTDPIKATLASVEFGYKNNSIEGTYFVPVTMLENIVRKQAYLGRRVAKRFEIDFIQLMKHAKVLCDTRTLHFYMDDSVIIVGLVPMLLIERQKKIDELPEEQRKHMKVDKDERGVMYTRKSGKMIAVGIYDRADNIKVPELFTEKLAEWTKLEIGNQEKELVKK